MSLYPPSTTTATLGASIESRLVADLYYHANGVVVGTLVLVSVNLAFYASRLPLPNVALWSLLLVASCVIRGASIFRYGRAAEAKSARRWHREVVAAYVVMAAGWGVLGLSSVLLLTPQESIVAIVTVAGITGSAAATTSASPVVFKSVGYIALAPLALLLLISGEGALPYVGAMSACYLVVLNRASARIHSTIRQSVTFGLENEQLVKTLARQSSVDSLTGLSNRRALNADFGTAWSDALAASQCVGLILCDIDHFKEYNDTYGHLEGDRCLQRVAQALQTVTRASDLTTARYGGEEFAVLLPHCEGAELEQIGERLRIAVQQLELPHTGSSVSSVVTMSVGASALLPVASLAVDDLIQAADGALYQAKEAGRNCVRIEQQLAQADS